MEDKKVIEKRVVKKYITIDDESIWELIDKIMQTKEYSKSFNKVINHALKFGIATLYEKVFINNNKSDVEEIENVDIQNIMKTPEEKQIEDYMKEIVSLLKENMVYLSITKSTVSTLFNVKVREIDGDVIHKDNVLDGSLRQTAKYLEGYEKYALSKKNKE